MGKAQWGAYHHPLCPLVMNRWKLEFDTGLSVESNLVLPPQCRSLLIHGNYHPRHPFTLCLSQLVNRVELGSPILITAQPRSHLIETLKTLELVEESGHGRTSDLLSKIRIYYPETSQHWLLILSLLHLHTFPNTSELRETPFQLESPVSMVILHEPGAYFLKDGNTNRTATIHHYLRLITTGLACTQSLRDEKTPPLVAFDSNINQLELSILPLENPSSNEEAYIQRVLPIAERYFDWACEVDYDNESENYKMDARRIHTEIEDHVISQHSGVTGRQTP